MYDVTGVIWPYPSLFVNNSWPNWARASGKTPMYSEWAVKSNNMQIEHPRSSTDLASRDLTLTWGQHETWSLLNKKYIIRRGLTRQTRWCQNFLLCDYFCRSYSLKTKPRHLGHWPDLWRYRLTWDLKFRYQSLRPVTPDTLVFFSRSSSSIRG